MAIEFIFQLLFGMKRNWPGYINLDYAKMYGHFVFLFLGFCLFVLSLLVLGFFVWSLWMGVHLPASLGTGALYLQSSYF